MRTAERENMSKKKIEEKKRLERSSDGCKNEPTADDGTRSTHDLYK